MAFGLEVEIDRAFICVQIQYHTIESRHLRVCRDKNLGKTIDCFDALGDKSEFLASH